MNRLAPPRARRDFVDWLSHLIGGHRGRIIGWNNRAAIFKCDYCDVRIEI